MHVWRGQDGDADGVAGRQHCLIRFKIDDWNVGEVILEALLSV